MSANKIIQKTSVWLVLILLSLLLTTTAGAQTKEPEQKGVPASRRERLSRGVNITLWFRAALDETPAYFENYITDADLDLIHDLGFKHVRLAIQPKYLYRPNNPANPDAQMLGYIDKALDRLLAHDLAVIVEIHNEAQVEGINLEKNSQAAGRFMRFWSTLARHLSTRDPEMVFLEVVNEPIFEKAPGQWLTIQKQLLPAMRAGAPDHTLIATGPFWSGIAGLQQVQPLNDPNIVYTFHFYEPMAFTHQGATWAGDELVALKGIPYPVDAGACKAAIAAINDKQAKAVATDYCNDERWDAAKLDARIAIAANWARRNNVFVLVGEFGVYPKVAPSAARLQWLRDVRTSFEKYGLGWTLWGYDDAFGLSRQISSNGQIRIDEDAAKALGLTLK